MLHPNFFSCWRMPRACALQDGYTPLHKACQKPQWRVVETLLKHGANADARSNVSCNAPTTNACPRFWRDMPSAFSFYVANLSVESSHALWPPLRTCYRAGSARSMVTFMFLRTISGYDECVSLRRNGTILYSFFVEAL